MRTGVIKILSLTLALVMTGSTQAWICTRIRDSHQANVHACCRKVSQAKPAPASRECEDCFFRSTLIGAGSDQMDHTPARDLCAGPALAASFVSDSLLRSAAAALALSDRDRP